ncbi:MAG: DNA oxidative demethylase AlkB [Nevskia sp.]|nr:DNA oxidative demethylase AlkB [Nevskia sp.]
MTLDLFTEPSTEPAPPETFAPGAVLLRAFALKDENAILAAIGQVAAAAPFRQMETPGGFRMSVAMTNCGALGWVTDRSGYRYTSEDPQSGRAWPAMPAIFRALAQSAAAQAGFAGFEPDACLVNRYQPGTRLTLHQDRNEKDFAQPIVSVSLGIPAVFLFGGPKRADRCARLRLLHGDVVVWGGPARLRFHGVMPLAPAVHPLQGAQRINLTLRRAG